MSTFVEFPIAAETSIVSKNSCIAVADSPPLHFGTNETSDKSLYPARLSGASSGAFNVGAFWYWWSVISIVGLK